MAIRGPKGPPGDPKGAQTADPSQKAAEKKRLSGANHLQPTADEFERIAESLAGSDFDQSDASKRRKRGNVQRRRAIYSRTVTRIGDDLQKFQREASRILSIIAAQTFSAAALERHKKELARIRERMERAYRHVLASQRSAREEHLGLSEIPESKMSRVEQELERLNQFESQWGKAMAALELVCENVEQDEARRLNMSGADFEKARDYAAIANPNTVAFDLASSALSLLESTMPPPKTENSKHELGRSLDGQHTLERIIVPPAKTDD